MNFDEENLAKRCLRPFTGQAVYVVVNIQAHGQTNFIEHPSCGRNETRCTDYVRCGMIMMVREAGSRQVIHLSVQANAVNKATVKFETNGRQPRDFWVASCHSKWTNHHAEVPDMSEVFVHGALCMAYSGRCLLYGYINKRDNRYLYQYLSRPSHTTPIKQKKAGSRRYRAPTQPITQPCCPKLSIAPEVFAYSNYYKKMPFKLSI